MKNLFMVKFHFRNNRTDFLFKKIALFPANYSNWCFKQFKFQERRKEKKSRQQGKMKC